MNRNSTRRQRVFALLGVIGPILVTMANARADSADLSFTPQDAAVMVNDVIQIELYVFSPPGENPPLSFVDALLIWDPAYLELLQASPASCFNATFLLCGFSPNPDSLNTGSGSPNLPNNDGDALYSALTNLSPAVIIPNAPGLKVTTFRFRALAETNATNVFLLDMWPGGISRTRVFAPGNVELTGDISAAVTTVAICGSTPDADNDGVADACDICPGADDHVDLDEDGIPDGCDPCPLTATPGITQGDVDGNNVINLQDTTLFIQVLLGVDMNPDHVAASDMNCDGNVNGIDIPLHIDQLI